MKTLKETKKGLKTCIGKCIGDKPHCPYHSYGDGCMDSMNRDAIFHIQQLESIVNQLSKALCDKENATLDEFLQAADQLKSHAEKAEQLEYELSLCKSTIEVFEKTFRDFQKTNDKLILERDDLKSRLAQAERERDAAVHDLSKHKSCISCKNEEIPNTCNRDNACIGCSNTDCPCSVGNTVNDCWQWRGVCPENTKEVQS